MTHAGAHHAAPQAVSQDHGQQHPLRVYFTIWGWLFVLSVASYTVDILHLQGMLRWSLITVFMLLKAGLIVAVFMHMVWERLALVYVVVVPPLLLLVLLGIGAIEAGYTRDTRGEFFKSVSEVAPKPH